MLRPAADTLYFPATVIGGDEHALAASLARRHAADMLIPAGHGF